jgi:RimJ/RimL family protein N-acetyltransferase
MGKINCRLDVFIEGETVDLCAPSGDESVLDQWFRWFNKGQITKYLCQGIYPNSIEKQRVFFQNSQNDNSRIVVLIKPKKSNDIIGVASLSHIDHMQRQCDFAMVIGERSSGEGSMFYGMEAKAMLTQHAFDTLGVERINSSQVKELVKWQRWQILFGYQIEGVLRNKFRKGQVAHDVFMSSCLLQDYNRVLKIRDGIFWPGKSKMLALMRSLPEKTLIDEVDEWISTGQSGYWNKIFGGQK